MTDCSVTGSESHAVENRDTLRGGFFFFFGFHAAALIVKVHSDAEDIQLTLLRVNC